MKKYSTLIIIFLFSLNVFGQSYIGVFAGLNNSKLSGDRPPDAKYKSFMGMNLGAHFDLKLSNATALSFQPSYSQEGTKIFFKVPKVDEPVDSLRLRLNFFSLPILFKIRSTNERFYAIGGIETAYLLSKELKSQDAKDDIKSTISDFNVALQFGAGMHIPIGYPRLFVEIRYTQGLINLTNEPLKNDIIPRVKMSGFKALVGIEFPLNNSKN